MIHNYETAPTNLNDIKIARNKILKNKYNRKKVF